jgi:hypothetical protein
MTAIKRTKHVFAVVNERREKWVVRTDRALELGVSPLVMGASELMLLPSSVACGAINCRKICRDAVYCGGW